MSRACLAVVAGILPIDLYPDRCIYLYRIKRKQSTALGEHSVAADMYEELDGLKIARNMVDTHLLRKWHARWDTARAGSRMNEFFLNIRNLLKCKWIRSTHHIMQFLNGHGQFRSILHTLGQRER